MNLINTKVILFDIDGTILDTTELIVRCYEHAILKHNLTPKTRKQILSVFGKPLDECYRSLYSNVNFSKISETHLLFQEKNLFLSKPFKGVEKVLKVLKKRGIKIAAISTRSKRTTTKSLNLNKIFSYFDLVISREDVINPKPHAEPLLMALNYFKEDPKFSVMVGDTPVDIKAGKNAKINTVGVSYGPLGNAVKKANPDIIISDIQELISLIAPLKTQA